MHQPVRADPAPRATKAAPQIRVLQFAYGTSLYGAERWILALLKHLDPTRVESTVACIREREMPLLEEASRLGFPTVVIESSNGNVLRAARRLRKTIRSHRIDILHSHGTRQDVLALLASRWHPCSTLSTNHGWEARGSLKLSFYDSLNKAILPFFDAVAPLSGGLIESLRGFRIPHSKLHLIPNGLDLQEIESAAPSTSFLPGVSSPSGFVIGYVGQLIPRKGLDTLLTALSLLDRADWHCLLLGDGVSRAELENQARALGLQERVTFLGFQANRLSYLKRLDLFVLPSYREGIPRAMMEALAAGVPCVGSRIPGIVELLEDGVTGTTFAVGDAQSLAAAIRMNLQDRASSALWAAAGKARIYERYSATAMATAYAGLYEKLFHERTR